MRAASLGNAVLDGAQPRPRRRFLRPSALAPVSAPSRRDYSDRLLAALAFALLGFGAGGAVAGDLPAEGVREALAALGSADPGQRAVGIARLGPALAQDPSLVARALPRLREAMRRGPEDAARIVRWLPRWREAQATALWLEAFDPEADDRVIAAAVEGTVDRHDDADVERRLLALARDDAASPARRSLALEAAGHLAGPAARLLLLSARPDEGWLEASGRALGLGHAGARGPGEPRLPWSDVVPALLAVLDHPDPAPRVHAWESLVRVTGEDFPASRAPWEAWWRARSAGPPPAAPAPSPPTDRYEAPPPAHVPTYYGIRIGRPRSHVVFCVDVSQSMWGSGIEQARRELGRAVGSLPTTYAFDVICFHEDVMPWAGRLVRAHPVQKARVLAWLKARKTVSYTNLFDAVETAFGYAGRGRHPAPDPVRLDAVFLLSDGAPNRGRLRGDREVVEGIAALSARTIPVHTIGAGEEVFPLLRRIASATGGSFADAFEFD